MNPKLNITYSRDLVLGIILALLVVVGGFGAVPLGKSLSEVFASNKTFKDESDDLANKADKLRNSDEVEIETRAEVVLQALPGKSSGVSAVVARSRELASTLGINLIQVRATRDVGDSSQQPQKDYSNVKIVIELEGDVNAVNNFLGRVEEFLPVTLVQGGKLTNLGGLTSARVEVATFWKKLPTELGGVDKPIPDLSTEEEKLFESLEEKRIIPSGVVSPTSGGTEPLSPPEPGRTNPFSF